MNRPYLIAGVADQRWFNAEASHVHALIRSLSDCGMSRVVMIHPDVTEYHLALESSGIRGISYRQPYRHFAPLPLFIRCLKVFRKLRPDWIYSSSTNASICAYSAAVFAGFEPRTALIRGTARAPKKSVITRKIFRAQNLCIAPSRLISDGHFGALSVDSHIIPQPVDERIFSPSGPAACDVPAGIIRILCVGRLDPVKGHDVLIRAVAGLIARGIDAELVLQGPEKNISCSEMNTLAESHGIKNRFRIILPGTIAPFAPWGAEVAMMMRCSHILAVPSLGSELNCRVLLEAMACGMPAVVSDAGSLPEICEDDVTGIVCPAGDHKSFADAFAGMISGKRIESMGRAAHSRYASLYSSRAASEKLWNLMNVSDE